jgi:hypothetical protein
VKTNSLGVVFCYSGDDKVSGINIIEIPGYFSLTFWALPGFRRSLKSEKEILMKQPCLAARALPYLLGPSSPPASKPLGKLLINSVPETFANGCRQNLYIVG